MTTTQEVRCPKCHGEMWDNRATKKNPKQPDFKCKDKTNCDGVIWPPKGGSPYAAPAAAPASNAKQGFSAGGPLPWEGEVREASEVPSRTVRPIVTPDYGDEPGHHAAIAALQAGKLEGLFVTYERCFDRALAVATKNLPPAMVTHEGVAAQAATLFIQASQKGLAA